MENLQKQVALTSKTEKVILSIFSHDILELLSTILFKKRRFETKIILVGLFILTILSSKIKIVPLLVALHNILEL